MKNAVASLNLQRTLVCRHLCATWVLGWMLTFTNPVDAQPETLVVKQVQGTASKIILQGEIVGEIRRKDRSDLYRIECLSMWLPGILRIDPVNDHQRQGLLG